MTRDSRPRSRPRLFAADPKEDCLLESPASDDLAAIAAPRRLPLGELNFSAEIEFYPSYALVKERSDDFSRQKLVELIGIEPTTSSLQS